MILCDIGNSRMHVYDGISVRHLSHEEGIALFRESELFFICVNDSVRERIGREAPGWIDISQRHRLKTDYEGLGIDREAACLGIEDGVVVDAGSAITVDVMEKGRHLGGWIWPGLSAWLSAYRDVSEKLAVELVSDVELDRLPLKTEDAVSFAILASVKTMIQRFAREKRIVVTGGDAPVVAHILPGAEIDETIVFKGMKKMIKDSVC